jgi:hypothetical protein
LHIAGWAPEGCLVIVVAGSAAIAAWVLVELLVPILLFAVYYLLVKAIARIANDRHGCEDKPVRALVWGTAWATLYIAPLVVLTWIVQSVLSSRG